MGNSNYQLLVATSEQWLDQVLTHFNDFLLDHASCERKAHAMALSMLAHYPDRTELVIAMMDLALEELNHFRQVMRLILQRNLVLTTDSKDPYIKQLQQNIRHGRDDYFLDRLLVASIVEKRGCERFGLIAQHIEDSQLKSFYQVICDSEAKHDQLFLQLASAYFPEAIIQSRLNTLLKIEADIINALPIRAALH